MEFFRYIDCTGISADAIKQHCTIASLPQYCASIDKLLSHEGEHGDIYCLWGQFSVQRSLLRNGVRFALLNCPHALCWTLTTDEAQQRLTLHCTIDKTAQTAGIDEFADSIELFLDDWQRGIGQHLCPHGQAIRQ